MNSSHFLGRYENLNRWLSYESVLKNPYDRFIINKLLNLHESGLILDNGAGNGRFSKYMSMRDSWIISLDISRTMVIHILGWIKSEYNNVIFPILGDIQHLPFRKDTFNKILCVHNLWYIPCFRKATSEMISSVKDRGEIIIDQINIFSPINFILYLLSKIRRKPTNYYRSIKTLLHPFATYPSRIWSIIYHPRSNSRGISKRILVLLITFLKLYSSDSTQSLTIHEESLFFADKFLIKSKIHKK